MYEYFSGMSFLERLINHNPLYLKNEGTKQYNSDVMVKLIKNYRSHSVILKVPNDLFYDGHLLVRFLSIYPFFLSIDFFLKHIVF